MGSISDPASGGGESPHLAWSRDVEMRWSSKPSGTAGHLGSNTVIAFLGRFLFSENFLFARIKGERAASPVFHKRNSEPDAHPQSLCT